MQEQVQERRALVGAMLQPMARLMQLIGLSCRDVNEEYRIASVKEAQKDLPAGVDANNVSLISARTGIGRRDVRNILALLRAERKPVVRTGHRSQRVISAWCHHARFRDQYGNPRILKISQGRSSFAQLCRLYAGEQHPIILKDLVQAEAVRELPGERLELLRQDYAAINLSPAGFAALVEQFTEHIETLTHNLTHPDAREQLVCRRAVNFNVKEGYVNLLVGDLANALNSQFDEFRDKLGNPFYSASDSTPAADKWHMAVTGYVTLKKGANSEADSTGTDMSRAGLADERSRNLASNAKKSQAKNGRLK